MRPLTFSWCLGVWHLCGQRKRRWKQRWRRLDLSFCHSLKCPATAEVKGLTSGPERLLRAVDPCDKPLDPAYPWAQRAFHGPRPFGCSPLFHHKPRVRNGQGRTNEVRAAVLGDLCPSEVPIVFWLGNQAESCGLYAADEWWICTTLPCCFCSLPRYWHCCQEEAKLWNKEEEENDLVNCCICWILSYHFLK